MTETYTSIVAHLRAGVYTCAAGGTILLYDIIITCEDEIRLIWASPFSLVKCLYFVNRYLSVPCLILGMYHLANLRGPLSTSLFVISQTPHASINNFLCKVSILSLTIGQAISVIVATWLLVIRVIAIYSGNKILAITLYFVFISTHVTTTVLSGLIMRDLWGSVQYLPSLGSCVESTSQLIGKVYFLPVIIEVMLVALQLFHAYRHIRGLRIKPRLPITPLLRMLYAGGFLYFVVVVTLKLWSGFLFILADYSYWYLSTYLEFALISTSVSRLVLHLRKAAEIDSQLDTNTGTSFQLSRLTLSASTNINANDNGSPYRNSTFFNKQNRNGLQPSNWNHHYHRKPPRNDTLSSFQWATETTHTYPPETLQVSFSPLEHLSGEESITSTDARG